MAAAKRLTTEQIVAKLREAEKLQGQGLTIPQVCKRLGVSDQTFDRWRLKYGALKEDEAQLFASLEHVYLEDSWILGLAFDADRLIFTSDFVLLDTHPRYSPPREGEQYCYIRGELILEDVTELRWRASGGEEGGGCHRRNGFRIVRPVRCVCRRSVCRRFRLRNG